MTRVWDNLIEEDIDMATAAHLVGLGAEREVKLRAYLKRVEREGLIPREIADSARQAWSELGPAVPELAVPDACPGPDGSLLYTWDSGAHHLELEFKTDEPPMFFYANRESSELWEAPFEA